MNTFVSFSIYPDSFLLSRNCVSQFCVLCIPELPFPFVLLLFPLFPLISPTASDWSILCYVHCWLTNLRGFDLIRLSAYNGLIFILFLPLLFALPPLFSPLPTLHPLHLLLSLVRPLLSLLHRPFPFLPLLPLLLSDDDDDDDDDDSDEDEEEEEEEEGKKPNGVAKAKEAEEEDDDDDDDEDDDDEEEESEEESDDEEEEEAPAGKSLFDSFSILFVSRIFIFTFVSVSFVSLSVSHLSLYLCLCPCPCSGGEKSGGEA